MVTVSGICAGCLNPLAPIEGNIGSNVWSDQTTVGGMLHNFELSYDYRDSLRYADCLDESFIFHYYDVETGHYDSWPRDTDLRATGGMFRTFEQIDLEWNSIPDTVTAFDQADQTLRFLARFNLTLGQEPPLLGYASFSVRMGEDGRFRVMDWQDDF